MKRNVILIVLAIFIFHCGSSADIKLEEAQFALDEGDFTTAVTKSQEVLNEDVTNVQAALLLSSALAGRGGIKLLQIADDLSNTSDNDDIFDLTHDALLGNITSTDDLRSAITTLSTTLIPQPTADHALFKDHQFQLGMLEVIEIFSRPSLAAQPTANGTITPTDITQAIKDLAQEDFRLADDHLINGGLKATNALVDILRENYCVLKNNSTAGTSGFTLAVLRDLNECELSADSIRGDLSSTNGDFESAITTCADFNFTTCDSAGDTTL